MWFIALKFFSFLICSVFFIILILDVWEKFTKKMTNMGVRFNDDKLVEKNFPCITVCPWNSFKTHGFHYGNDSFYKQTYDKDEILYIRNVSNPTDTSSYYIEELKGVLIGRCYMVCF